MMIPCSSSPGASVFLAMALSRTHCACWLENAATCFDICIWVFVGWHCVAAMLLQWAEESSCDLASPNFWIELAALLATSAGKVFSFSLISTTVWGSKSRGDLPRLATCIHTRLYSVSLRSARLT